MCDTERKNPGIPAGRWEDRVKAYMEEGITWKEDVVTSGGQRALGYFYHGQTR